MEGVFDISNMTNVKLSFITLKRGELEHYKDSMGLEPWIEPDLIPQNVVKNSPNNETCHMKVYETSLNR